MTTTTFFGAGTAASSSSSSSSSSFVPSGNRLVRDVFQFSKRRRLARKERRRRKGLSTSLYRKRCWNGSPRDIAEKRRCLDRWSSEETVFDGCEKFHRVESAVGLDETRAGLARYEWK